MLNTKENAYIDAARAIGAGHIRIMFHYILPNIMPVVIVLAGRQRSGARGGDHQFPRFRHRTAVSHVGAGPRHGWAHVRPNGGASDVDPGAAAIFLQYTRLTCLATPFAIRWTPGFVVGGRTSKPEPRVPFSLTRRSVADYVPGSLGPALWMIVLFTILPVLACGGDDTSSDNPTAR